MLKGTKQNYGFGVWIKSEGSLRLHTISAGIWMRRWQLRSGDEIFRQVFKAFQLL